VHARWQQNACAILTIYLYVYFPTSIPFPFSTQIPLVTVVLRPLLSLAENGGVTAAYLVAAISGTASRVMSDGTSAEIGFAIVTLSGIVVLCYLLTFLALFLKTFARKSRRNAVRRGLAENEDNVAPKHEIDNDAADADADERGTELFEPPASAAKADDDAAVAAAGADGIVDDAESGAAASPPPLPELPPTESADTVLPVDAEEVELQV
jgi:hypothetical protein